MRRLLTYFVTSYPGRTVTMITLMVAAGIAEGVGLLTLIPVLEVTGGQGGATSSLGQMVIDGVRWLGLEPTLGGLLIAMVVAMLFKAALLYLALKHVGFTVAQVAQDLRLRLIGALLGASWSFSSTQASGKHAGSINSETNRASAAFREGCQVVASGIQIVAYLAVAALVSWRIALGAAVLGSVMTLLLSRFFGMSRLAGHSQTQHNRALAARLTDVLQGIKSLKAMGKEDLVWPLLAAESEGLNEAQKKQVLASERLKFFQEPVIMIFMALGLYVALEVGEQPMSQILVLALIFYRVMRHVSTLQMRYQIVITGEGAFSKLMDEIEEGEAAREELRKDGPRIQLTRGVRVDRVSFSYGNTRILNDIELDIPAGSFVVLAGESGSGKTTLADLVAGLRPPGAGTILIDGRPLSEIDMGAWRRSIGYVPQELLLFNDTIERNVTLGDPSITEEDVERALRLAEAWPFVSSREKGLQHPVGERGIELSGGQRQRIAIARALVTRPTLLILDEVTTALDPDTEREICRTLRELAGEVTILTISHQPAIREVADVVYEMRNGQLHELRHPVST